MRTGGRVVANLAIEPDLIFIRADERTAEVWKPGGTEPAVVHDVLEWSVSGHRFGISLDEVFRSWNSSTP